MGRRGYPAEFRRRVLDLVEAGRKVADVACDLGVSDQTIYTWRRQDRIDRGLEPGATSAELAELTAAKQRIRELEAEVAIHRRATEKLKEHGDPKGALVNVPWVVDRACIAQRRLWPTFPAVRRSATRALEAACVLAGYGNGWSVSMTAR